MQTFHASTHPYRLLALLGIGNGRAIALKARPGTITDEELEKEKGGSGLRGHATYEVGVDGPDR